MTPSTFCATCLADDSEAGLRVDLGVDGRALTLCRACRTGHPRSGRWSFDEGSEGFKGTGGTSARGEDERS